MILKFFLSIILLLIIAYPFLRVRGDKTRFYQLPVIFSITTCALIIPSLFGQIFSNEILSDNEYNYYTLNVILCLLASYIGYGYRLKARIINNKYDTTKILFGVLPFFLIGFFISFFLISAEEFGGVFGGMFAVLLFFARMIRPAAIVLLFVHLIKPRLLTWFLLLLWLVVPLRFIIISGRRSEFFMLIITILMPLFFVKNFVPSKKYMIIGSVICFAAFFVLPMARVYTRKGDFNEVKNIDFIEGIVAYNEGEKTNEVFEAAINMNIVFEKGGYSYGGLYINKFVNQFASTTFFGGDLKESLQMYQFDIESSRNNLVDYKGSYKNYLAPSGFVDSFYDFGFLAFIPFLLFARVSKIIWVQAYYSKNLYSKIFYSYFVVLMFMSIYDSLSFLPVLLVQVYIVFFPINNYSRV